VKRELAKAGIQKIPVGPKTASVQDHAIEQEFLDPYLGEAIDFHLRGSETLHTCLEKKLLQCDNVA
jgi:hypothetical protein